MTDSILSLVRKVAELADRGVAGERDAAIAKLRMLMRKYKLTTKDVESLDVVPVTFKYRTLNEKILGVVLVQIVCGTLEIQCRYSGRKKTIIFYITVAQKKEWQAMLMHYRIALRKEESLFLLAFLHRQELRPPTSSARPATEEELLTLRGMLAYMEKSSFPRNYPAISSTLQEDPDHAGKSAR